MAILLVARGQTEKFVCFTEVKGGLQFKNGDILSGGDDGHEDSLVKEQRVWVEP